MRECVRYQDKGTRPPSTHHISIRQDEACVRSLIFKAPQATFCSFVMRFLSLTRKGQMERVRSVRRRSSVVLALRFVNACHPRPEVLALRSHKPEQAPRIPNACHRNVRTFGTALSEKTPSVYGLESATLDCYPCTVPFLDRTRLTSRARVVM